MAKNYLSDMEMTCMKRVVTLYLDYEELKAEGLIPMSMEDGFLEFNENELMTNVGNAGTE
ncbi:virulence RhuM family protein [[Clostridium] symbiosum]|uniref:RhuM family protein n=1 Tax=Clostridium symbiosum TaxID=1512 RepID=UPI00210C97F9|nr:virulence RhuM family protein [[Clostridium] symbiosum]